MDFWSYMLGKQHGGEGGGTAEEKFPIGDGNSHLWIDIDELRLSPVLGLGVNGKATVDWGDGTAPVELTGTDENTMVYTPGHRYAAAGKYHITVAVEGNVTFGCYSGAINEFSGTFLTDNEIEKTYYYYSSILRKVELGDNTAIADCAFFNCCGLEKAYLAGTTGAIGSYSFESCYILRELHLNDNITSIKTNAIKYCTSLTQLHFPPNLTTIAPGVFTNSTSLKLLDFSRCTAVPTLENVSALSSLPSDVEIRVPAALEEEWKAATNWERFSKYIVGA